MHDSCLLPEYVVEDMGEIRPSHLFPVVKCPSHVQHVLCACSGWSEGVEWVVMEQRRIVTGQRS